MTDKVNVLLADECPANLLALEATLEDLKLNIVKAYSGKEALEFLVENEFAPGNPGCSNAGHGWF